MPSGDSKLQAWIHRNLHFYHSTSNSNIKRSFLHHSLRSNYWISIIHRPLCVTLALMPDKPNAGYLCSLPSGRISHDVNHPFLVQPCNQSSNWLYSFVSRWSKEPRGSFVIWLQPETRSRHSWPLVSWWTSFVPRTADPWSGMIFAFNPPPRDDWNKVRKLAAHRYPTPRH